MNRVSQSTQRWSALMLAFAAVHFGVHLWFLLRALPTLNRADRAAYLDASAESIAYWLAFCGAAIVLGVPVLRYDRLTPRMQRVLLVACSLVAAAVGYVGEWWAALYFLFPVLFLAGGRGTKAHA
jgi:hypothetical protein